MDAVKTITRTSRDKKEIDINRYATDEKSSRGMSEDSTVQEGVTCNKEVTDPKIKRRVENANVVL